MSQPQLTVSSTGKLGFLGVKRMGTAGCYFQECVHKYTEIMQVCNRHATILATSKVFYRETLLPLPLAPETTHPEELDLLRDSHGGERLKPWFLA